LIPEALRVSDLDPPKVLAFLDDLEQSRGNSVRTRSAVAEDIDNLRSPASAKIRIMISPNAIAIICGH
jgi:hypothetical protein